MSRFRLIVTLPLLLIVVLFAVVNRTAVPVNFWPFPYAVDLPLSAVAFGGFFLGALSGGLAVWLGGMRKRRRERQQVAAAAKVADIDDPMPRL
ncbi:LapA family protein [Emcibacter sp. SYSU 3D8]|uniref:LapA family protein n=1 Tax=Emcibacter sp. SYSU 3D8 TaxID=3133969 RepID=UPI0031FEDCF9